MAEEDNELFNGLSSFLLSQENVSVDSLENLEDPDKDKPKDDLVSLDELEEELKGTKVDNEDESAEEVGGTTKSSNNNSSIYKALSGLLKEEGILEEEFEDKDSLFNYFKTVTDKNVEEWKENLPKEIHDLIDNYEEGVPFDELLQIKSTQIKLDSITEEKLQDNVEIQKNLLRNFYSEKGFNEAKIEKMISKFEELDELEEESIDALEELKTIEANKLVKLKEQEAKRLAEEKRNYEETVNKLNTTVKELKEIIPGVKIDDKTKKELMTMLTKPAAIKDGVPYSNVMLIREKNPIDFELKLNYYAKLGLFDENPKFDIIMKKTETKAVSKLEKQIEESLKERLSKSTNTRGGDSDGDDDIFKGLASFLGK